MIKVIGTSAGTYWNHLVIRISRYVKNPHDTLGLTFNYSTAWKGVKIIFFYVGIYVCVELKTKIVLIITYCYTESVLYMCSYN